MRNLETIVVAILDIVVKYCYTSIVKNEEFLIMSDSQEALSGQPNETNSDADIEDEIQALSSVLKSLGPLSSKQREWVISSAISKYAIGVKAPEAPKSFSTSGGVGGSAEVESGALSDNPKVNKWMKDSGVTQDALDNVFYIAPGGVDIVISEIPGKSKKEQTINAYVLMGASKFIKSGEAQFTDQEARELCESMGCYDLTNHSKTIKDKGNLLAGSKSVGWNLTKPGLKAAAEIIKAAN